jgi:hypothetical protein
MEEAVGLTRVAPFLVGYELKRNGGKFSRQGGWRRIVVADCLLITGQNSASLDLPA